MKTLILHELKYISVLLTFVIFVVVAHLVLLKLFQAFPNSQKEGDDLIIATMLGVLPVLVLAKSWLLIYREKRLRFYFVLPLSKVKIAVVRTLIFFIPLVAILLIYFVVFNIEYKSQGTLFNYILQQSGLTIVIVTSVLISDDIANIFIVKKKLVFVEMLITLFAFDLIVVLISANYVFNSNLYFPISLYLIGICNLFASPILFTKRKLFLR